MLFDGDGRSDILLRDSGGAADEHNIRNFWNTWSRYMSGSGAKGQSKAGAK
mgnify:CR=1 FL=1